MDHEAQQRIMGFFIEEARDHLVTLEQGMLSLRTQAGDSELINELFRAAHSIKGGAAMLGINTIQQAAHRLEDCFKVFRERDVPVDQELETLLLSGYDTVAALFDQLQGPGGLTPENGGQLLAAAEPNFVRLEAHLSYLLGEGPQPTAPGAPPPPVAVSTPAPPEPSPTPTKESIFTQTVPRLLQAMLELFKQREQPHARGDLSQIADQMAAFGTAYHLPTWTHLNEVIGATLAEPSNNLRDLALLILRDLKQAQQLVLQGQEGAIAPSTELLAFLPLPPAPSEPELPLEEILAVPEPLLSDDPLPAESLFDDPLLADPLPAEPLQPSPNAEVERGEARGDIDPEALAPEELAPEALAPTEFAPDALTPEISDSIDELLAPPDEASGFLDWAPDEGLDFLPSPELEAEDSPATRDNDIEDLFADFDDVSPLAPSPTDEGEISDDSTNADDLLDFFAPESSPVAVEDVNEATGFSDWFSDESDEPADASQDDLFAFDNESVPAATSAEPSLAASSDPEVDEDDLPTSFTDWFADVSPETEVIEPAQASADSIEDLMTDLFGADELGSAESGMGESVMAESGSDELASVDPATAQGDDTSSLEPTPTPIGTGETDSIEDFMSDLFGTDELGTAESGMGESGMGESVMAESWFDEPANVAPVASAQSGDTPALEPSPDPIGAGGAESIEDLMSDLFGADELGTAESGFDEPANVAPVASAQSGDTPALEPSSDPISAGETESIEDLMSDLFGADELGTAESGAGESLLAEPGSDELASVPSVATAQNEDTPALEPTPALGEVPDSEDDLDFINDILASSDDELDDITPTALDLESDEESALTGLFEDAERLASLEEDVIPALDPNRLHLEGEDYTSLPTSSAQVEEDLVDLFSDLEAPASEAVTDPSAADPSVPESSEAELPKSEPSVFDPWGSHPAEPMDAWTLAADAPAMAEDPWAASDPETSETPVSELVSSESAGSPDQVTDHSASLAELFGEESLESDLTQEDSTATDTQDLINDILGLGYSPTPEVVPESPTESRSPAIASPEEIELQSLDDFFASGNEEISVETSSLSGGHDPESLAADPAPPALSESDELSSIFEEAELEDVPADWSTEPTDFELPASPTGTWFTDDALDSLEDTTAASSLADLFTAPAPTETLVSESSSTSEALPQETLASPVPEVSVPEVSEDEAWAENLAEFEAEMPVPAGETSLDDQLDDLAALLGTEAEGPDEGSTSEAHPAQLNDLAAIFGEQPAATDQAPAVDQLANLDTVLDSFAASLELPTPAPAAPISPITPISPVTPVPSAAPRQAPQVVSPPTPVVRPTGVPPVSGRRAAASPTMRVEVKYLDSINNLVGELVVNRNSLEQTQGRLRQFLENLLQRVRQISDVGQRMQDQYERSLLEASLLQNHHSHQGVASGRSTTESSSRTGHATGLDFDALEMDRFTTFHTLSQEIIELIVRIRESSSDIEFVVDESEQISRQFRQVTSQLQDGLNRARMVPFSQISDRLPRAVRDLSIKTGKQINLVVEGRETLIDKAILEELYDPMTHLVNNAIVHGIEPPDVRTSLGKDPVGQITIRTFYQGNQTIISVSDDGAGINTDRVKEKALKIGLLTPEQVQDMSDIEINDVIFDPGFTILDQANDLAGRGVGTDVVRTRLNELRGSVQADSERGQGTIFTIRLPLTLSVSKSMVCVSDRTLIAFPLDGVEEMLDVPRDQLAVDEQGRNTIPWRDQRLPFQPLSSLLTYHTSRSRTEVYGLTTQDEDVVPVVILQSGGQRVALQVDSFVEEQEIVIKQLSGPTPKPIGIAGATVLGNGKVLPIADILELIDLSHGRIRRDPSRIATPDLPGGREVPDRPRQRSVLIVDDSITVRELLSMSFVKAGFRVEQARDGQDAWDKLRSGLPCDLVFCDIEMPRMDGLELLSRLQKDEHLQSLPVAMLTSRGADRHRQMAASLGARAYFTKPYLEEELLNAANQMLAGAVLLKAAAEG